MTVTGSRQVCHWSDVAANSCVALAANFGVDLSKGGMREFGHACPVRLLLLSIFVTGNVIFMGYRASLTSKLAVRRLQLPFTDLRELLETDFK